MKTVNLKLTHMSGSVSHKACFPDNKYVLDISQSGGGLWAYIARETIGRGRSPRPIVSSAIMPINPLQTGRYLIYTMDAFDVLKNTPLIYIMDAFDVLKNNSLMDS